MPSDVQTNRRADERQLISQYEDTDGIITRLHTAERKKDVVMDAVMERDSGGALAFVMRGTEVKGIIQIGDRVRLKKITAAPSDGILPVSSLQNLTTNSGVQVWTPPLLSRARMLSGPFLISAIVGPAVGATTGALVKFSSGSGAPAPIITTDPVSTSTTTGGTTTTATTSQLPPNTGPSTSAFDTWLVVGVALVIGLLTFTIAAANLHRARQRARKEFLAAGHAQAASAA